MSAQSRVIIRCDAVYVLEGPQSLPLRRRRCAEETVFIGKASVSHCRSLLASRGWTYQGGKDLCPEDSRS